MKIILLNDVQRNKIIKYVKPSKNDYYSYQNLDLLTAVSDDAGKYILTMSYYLSSSIRRMDDNYDECKYVLLTGLGCFSVSCIEAGGKYSGVFSPLPILISNNDILKMIRYYSDGFSERRALQRKAKSEIDTGNKGFTEWYLENYYFNRKN